MKEIPSRFWEAFRKDDLKDTNFNIRSHVAVDTDLENKMLLGNVVDLVFERILDEKC